MKKTKKNIRKQLVEAAYSGSTKEVERCLSHADCDPLVRDNDGCSALMLTAWNGDEACMRLLLPVSDPLEKTNMGISALMFAAADGHEACVRILLPVSDPFAKDKDGWSALMWAALRGHKECVKLLLSHSDLLALSHKGRSTSQMAIDNGQSEIADMIDAYVLALKEAAILSTDITLAPPRRSSVIRI